MLLLHKVREGSRPLKGSPGWRTLNTGTLALEHWTTGTLERWNARRAPIAALIARDHRRAPIAGTLDRTGSAGTQDGFVCGMQDGFVCGTLGRWCAGTLERRHAGTLDHWNAAPGAGHELLRRCRAGASRVRRRARRAGAAPWCRSRVRCCGAGPALRACPGESSPSAGPAPRTRPLLALSTVAVACARAHDCRGDRRAARITVGDRTESKPGGGRSTTVGRTRRPAPVPSACGWGAQHDRRSQRRPAPDGGAVRGHEVEAARQGREEDEAPPAAHRRGGGAGREAQSRGRPEERMKLRPTRACRGAGRGARSRRRRRPWPWAHRGAAVVRTSRTASE